MKRFLIILSVVFLGLSSAVNAQDPLYSNEDFKKMLDSYSEVIVVMDGFDYKYTGNWKTTMEIKGNHALVFTRGKVTHSFDLTKVTFVQEEGHWVKLWLTR